MHPALSKLVLTVCLCTSLAVAQAGRYEVRNYQLSNNQSFSWNQSIFPVQPLIFSAPPTLDGNAYWLSTVSGDSLQPGKRDILCECFDPDQKCCIPATLSLGLTTITTTPPFCIPANHTCCAATFCSEDQTCCDDGTGQKGCCPVGTVCNASGRGCCPIGKYCLGPSVCYDAFSYQCTRKEIDPLLCCPISAPFCRHDVPEFGTGCFSNSTLPQPVTTTVTETPISRNMSLASSSPDLTSTFVSTDTVSTVSITSQAGPTVISPSRPSTPITTSKATSVGGLCWNGKLQALGPCDDERAPKGTGVQDPGAIGGRIAGTVPSSAEGSPLSDWYSFIGFIVGAYLLIFGLTPA